MRMGGEPSRELVVGFAGKLGGVALVSLLSPDMLTAGGPGGFGQITALVQVRRSQLWAAPPSSWGALKYQNRSPKDLGTLGSSRWTPRLSRTVTGGRCPADEKLLPRNACCEELADGTPFFILLKGATPSSARPWGCGTGDHQDHTWRRL